MNEKTRGVTTRIKIEDVEELPPAKQLPERLQEAAALYAELGREWLKR